MWNLVRGCFPIPMSAGSAAMLFHVSASTKIKNKKNPEVSPWIHLLLISNIYAPNTAHITIVINIFSIIT